MRVWLCMCARSVLGRRLHGAIDRHHCQVRFTQPTHPDAHKSTKCRLSVSVCLSVCLSVPACAGWEVVTSSWRPTPDPRATLQRSKTPRRCTHLVGGWTGMQCTPLHQRSSFCVCVCCLLGVSGKEIFDWDKFGNAANEFSNKTCMYVCFQTPRRSPFSVCLSVCDGCDAVRVSTRADAKWNEFVNDWKEFLGQAKKCTRSAHTPSRLCPSIHPSIHLCRIVS